MNERGALTLDFIFALVLVSGLTGILLALSLTLVVTEVAQYVAFASSRAYFGAHLSLEEQQAQAKAKFEQLQKQKGISGIFSGGWFKISYVENNDFKQEYAEAAEESLRGDIFEGVRLTLEAPVLTFKVPFYGSTAPEGETFKANVNSFLGREPSFEECMAFERQRWEELKARFPGMPSSSGDGGYKVIMDNGC